MRTKSRCLLLANLLASLCCIPLSIGQERARTVEKPGSSAAQDPAEELVRVNTRVVFIDTLVTDKRTAEPIDGLTREDFEVLDNGRPRVISYFSHEGDRRRPLALLIVLAPLDDGARKGLQTPEVTNSIAAALVKLSPEDEVALMLVWRSGVSRVLADLTRDRARLVSAFTVMPKETSTNAPLRPPKIIQDAALSMASQRPGSQVRVVLVTDSVFLISHAERDEMVRNLIRANVTFNALITGTDKFFAAFSPLLKPAENDLRASWYDVPQYLAKQTGGDHVRARKKKDYGRALEKLIGNLTARYSIGFTLAEDEMDDGQMHRLEVRVRMRDSQGKQRKVEVSARQGYYTPKK
jgi:Ca-activated chloride channel homolog